MFSSMNTFILESYLELNMTMWICIKSVIKNWGKLGTPSFGDYLSIALGLIFSIMVHLLPVYVMCKY